MSPHTHTPFLRKNRSPSLYPWWNSSSSWLQDVGHNAFVRRTIFFALICSGWSEMLTMCGEADSPWGQMSQSPLNGDTEMTSGSELKGMLLVKPPSQHRCRKKGREEGERRKGVKVNLTCHMLRYGLVYKHLSQERKHCPSIYHPDTNTHTSSLHW